MLPLKTILLTSMCALALSACGTAGTAANKGKSIEITGGTSTTMSNEPIVPSDPNVQVFPTEGTYKNPLSGKAGHGVLDNTTSGGYTVFDESVTVYPLPGENAPAYVPSYAVPPFAMMERDDVSRAGQTAGMASASALPPVPNVDVTSADPYSKPPTSGAMRQPLMLTAPEPLKMQPLAQARAAAPSPFQPAPATTGKPRAPQLTGIADAVPPRAAAVATPTPLTPAAPKSAITAAGKRSAPSLTGY